VATVEPLRGGDADGSVGGQVRKLPDVFLTRIADAIEYYRMLAQWRSASSFDRLVIGQMALLAHLGQHQTRAGNGPAPAT
jgi:hypothetical protein